MSDNKAEGWPIPENTIRNDWLTIFIITIVLLYVLVKKARPFLHEADKFFLMKGIAEHPSYGKGSLFTGLNCSQFYFIFDNQSLHFLHRLLLRSHTRGFVSSVGHITYFSGYYRH